MPATPDFAEIDFGSPAYDRALRLREELLRLPLGLGFSAEDLADEPVSRHFVLVEPGGELAGVLVATPRPGGETQLRQMAIADDWREQGLGRALCEFAEAALRRDGVTDLFLHARDTAVGFYAKLGFVPDGEPFESLSIMHQKMVKSLA